MLLSLLITLIVIGLVGYIGYIILGLIPMPAPVKQIALAIWLVAILLVLLLRVLPLAGVSVP